MNIWGRQYSSLVYRRSTKYCGTSQTEILLILSKTLWKKYRGILTWAKVDYPLWYLIIHFAWTKRWWRDGSILTLGQCLTVYPDSLERGGGGKSLEHGWLQVWGRKASTCVSVEAAPKLSHVRVRTSENLLLQKSNESAKLWKSTFPKPWKLTKGLQQPRKRTKSW